MDKYIFLKKNIINIIIPENTDVLEAIVLENISNKTFQFINIIAKNHSRAIIINKLNIRYCKGLLEDHSHLTIIKSQENINENLENQETWNLCNNSILSLLDLEILNIGSQKSYDYFLSGSNSQLYHVTKSLMKNSNKASLRTSQVHSSQYSKSSIIVKYILLDESEANYNSLIKIDQNGKETDAIQRQGVLLLSDKAKNTAIPALEVESSAVRCKHGAATGYIDEEHLWYLKSKGFSVHEAHKHILLGFFKDTQDIEDRTEKLEKQETGTLQEQQEGIESQKNGNFLNYCKIIDRFYDNCIRYL